MKRTLTLNKSSPLKKAKIVVRRQNPRKTIFLSLFTTPRANAYIESKTKITASFGYHASRFMPQSLPYFVVYSKLDNRGKSQNASKAKAIPKINSKNLKFPKISFLFLCSRKKIDERPPIIAV